MKQMTSTFLAVLAGLLITSCRDQSPGTRAVEFSSNVTAYAVKGVLKTVIADGTKARIAHERIPGYMEAMTMVFDVKNTNELAGVQPGDRIAFRLLVTETEDWIDQVKKIGDATSAPVR